LPTPGAVISMTLLLSPICSGCPSPDDRGALDAKREERRDSAGRAAEGGFSGSKRALGDVASGRCSSGGACRAG
jgi:hypothetical protein